METPIQKLIAELRTLKAESCYVENPALDTAIKAAERYLPREQSEIQDAFDSGQANADPKCRDVEDGKEYFLKLFVDPALKTEKA